MKGARTRWAASARSSKQTGRKRKDTTLFPSGGLEPHTQGPGPHSHEEDDIFYVIEGTMSFLIGDSWIDAPKGSFVLAPGGMTHDFQNRSSNRAGVLNFSIPGDFEKNMPAIAKWFAENPPKDAEKDPLSGCLLILVFCEKLLCETIVSMS